MNKSSAVNEQNHFHVSQWAQRRFERDTRYYQLHLQQDLWGNWAVMRAFGGINTMKGRAITETYKDQKSAEDAFNRLSTFRTTKRGYSLTT